MIGAVDRTFSRAFVTAPIATAQAIWAEAQMAGPFDPVFLPHFEWRMSPDIHRALVAAVRGPMAYPAVVAEERLFGHPVAVDATLPPGWMQLDMHDPGPG